MSYELNKKAIDRRNFMESYESGRSTLQATPYHPLINMSNDDIIFNYSHRVLPEAEKTVLARGLRFCLPLKEVDTYDVKCSFELPFRDLGSVTLVDTGPLCLMRARTG